MEMKKEKELVDAMISCSQRFNKFSINWNIVDNYDVTGAIENYKLKIENGNFTWKHKKIYITRIVTQAKIISYEQAIKLIYFRYNPIPINIVLKGFFYHNLD